MKELSTRGGISESPRVTIFIPTWNAGDEFPAILRKMLAQDLDCEFEVVVIDSGSTDGTLDFLQTQPVRLYQISNREFNHGLTRNAGVELARGEIVVLATQDALPFDTCWLQRLVDCYDDPKVMGAYSRQLPRPDANPFIRDRLSHWVAAKEEPRVQEIPSSEEFAALPPLEQLSRVAFDNVSSSIRKSVAVRIPFRRRQFGEDLDWGHRAVLAGHRIVFEPRSKVIHSHNNSVWYEFKRVYLDHQNLHRLFGVHTVRTWRDVWACGVHATGHLWKVVGRDRDLGMLKKLGWRLKALPLGFSQNLAQFLGARSVRKLEERDWVYGRLDRWFRKGI